MCYVRVEGHSVRSSSLHVLLPFAYRIYGVPFAIAYAVLLGAYAAYAEHIADDVALLIFLGVALLHGLSFLVCEWSVHFKTMLTCRRVSSLC